VGYRDLEADLEKTWNEMTDVEKEFMMSVINNTKKEEIKERAAFSIVGTGNFTVAFQVSVNIEMK